MKILKFIPSLIPLVLSREKTSTWRLWDDKDLQVGDKVSFLNSATKEEFAIGELTQVIEKQFKDLTDEDWSGHEKFENEKEMYESYSKYYSREVTPKTFVKIIHFKLL